MKKMINKKWNRTSEWILCVDMRSALFEVASCSLHMSPLQLLKAVVLVEAAVKPALEGRLPVTRFPRLAADFVEMKQTGIARHL